MKTTKFNKLFPKAKNIELGTNGIVWGVWFNLNNFTSQKTFYPIEFQPDEDVLFEEEVITISSISGLTNSESQKICLN